LDPIAAWITNAVELACRDMPATCFSLVFRMNNNVHVWALVKKAAALQEAFAVFQHRQGIRPYSLDCDPDRYRFRYPLPWYVPSSFPQAVKDIVLDTSVVKIEQRRHLRTGWNLERLLHGHADWSIPDWRTEWRDMLNEHSISIPSRGVAKHCGGFPP
jgi:hypothetical protein